MSIIYVIRNRRKYKIYKRIFDIKILYKILI